MLKRKMRPDVIIVGTGAAGLFSALQIDKNKSVLMITKDEATNSDSYLAQGGISTLKTPDDYDAYFEDTMRAGCYENNKESVKVMIESSPVIIEDLVDYGVEFDKEGEHYSYTREGAHSTFRILHHKDVTGKEITSKLLDQARKRENIDILEYTTMLDLICHENQCHGIVVKKKDNTIETIYAKTVVLATGGLGGLFEHSTNFRHITGDALALALKHHIEIENINYIQIHPTTLYTNKPGRSFLISESVRGEGAYLYNKNGERFVDELLPRDVVSTVIREQMAKDHSDYVYLSVTHLDGNEVKERFPNIYERCLEEGYDITKEYIPVTPAQHYHMGGIKVNLLSQTSMRNLYAVGEASCNGVHGANRLASNSLLESLVFAKRAANRINGVIDSIEVDDSVGVNMAEYQDLESLNRGNKAMILNEIKRRDEDFYDKWCNQTSQCG